LGDRGDHRVHRKTSARFRNCSRRVAQSTIQFTVELMSASFARGRITSDRRNGRTSGTPMTSGGPVSSEVEYANTSGLWITELRNCAIDRTSFQISVASETSGRSVSFLGSSNRILSTRCLKSWSSPQSTGAGVCPFSSERRASQRWLYSSRAPKLTTQLELARAQYAESSVRCGCATLS
jgi:hypothetical protein